MPRATASAPLIRNLATELFRVYLDRLVIDDIHFNNCVDHWETRPFDEIILYYRWLACGSRLTVPHLPERVMRQFNYTQTIPRHHVFSTSLALTRRHVDVMFDDYESHLVSEEAHSTIALSEWSYVDGYIRWFFRVSHPYMVHAVPRDPPRPAHQKILEEEQS
ncbi:unnamed protein product [Lathyrus oleraceus]